MSELLLGVPSALITPGLGVMVPYSASALVNGDPVLICFARVLRAADDPGLWWLDVYVSPTVHVPQMFREVEILGVPALGIGDVYE